MKRCPYCAEEIPENAKACPHCGLAIKKTSDSPTIKGKKIHSIWGKISLILPGLLIILYILVFLIYMDAATGINKEPNKIFAITTLVTSILFITGFIISIVEIIRNIIKKKYRIIFPILGLIIDIPAIFFSVLIMLIMASGL